MNINTSNLDTTIEHWASIDGYLNYQVSWWGRVMNTKTGRILKGSMTRGYLRVGLCKNGKHKLISVHSLVAREWVPNPENKRCVDHINGDRSNNNYENLRYATSAENSMNRATSNDRSSVYKGVSIHKATNKWQTFIWINGANKNLGSYTTEREAAEVYNAAAVKFYKNFAKLNVFED